MAILKQIGWYTYAALATILTFGVFLRFHLVTVRMRSLGGLRAGGLGGKHVYHEVGSMSGADYIVVSTWFGKSRMPLKQLGHTETKLATVTIVFKGKRKPYALWAWSAGVVAEYVNDFITDIDMGIGQA